MYKQSWSKCISCNSSKMMGTINKNIICNQIHYYYQWYFTTITLPLPSYLKNKYLTHKNTATNKNSCLSYFQELLQNPNYYFILVYDVWNMAEKYPQKLLCMKRDKFKKENYNWTDKRNYKFKVLHFFLSSRNDLANTSSLSIAEWMLTTNAVYQLSTFLNS